MGGFAVEPGLTNNLSLPGNPSRLILTPTAIRLLADKEPRLIPDISEEQIHDKSKASGLAKSLVCMQASWFCIQCIYRLAHNLSISLLELNTFAHAICTLLIYLLWWNKPLDIEEPTIIQGDNADAIFAMMAMLDCAQRNPRGSTQGFKRTKGYCSISHDSDATPPVETVDETVRSFSIVHQANDYTTNTIEKYGKAKEKNLVKKLYMKDFLPQK